MSSPYRMPAEWELHAATWLTWPHCEATWPGRLDQVVPAYVEMIRALASSEVVYVNTLDEDHRESVRSVLASEGVFADSGCLQLLILPTDDEWIRDYGAIFVHGPDGLIATNWEFNAWGRKYDRIETNNRVPIAMANTFGVDHVAYHLVLEGGAVDVNGKGACLTTQSCLLNPNRNSALSRAEIEAHLDQGLGINDVIWLGEGIEGDDTDGHIDDLARFVGQRKVVISVEDDPTDDNFRPLRENLDRLHSHRMRDGSELEIVELPMPPPLFHQEQRLPASYANFYIANSVVLMPTFGVHQDEMAEERLQAYFPRRRVVPIDASVLVGGFGSCHCLTQQVPASLT